MNDLICEIIMWGIAFLYPTICAWRATVAERKNLKSEEGWE